MSYSYSKRSYSPSAANSSSPSQAIEDSKKKTSLLKDSSWIRRDAEEDEAVDRDPNFGRVVLNKYRSNEALDSAEPADSKSPKTTTTKTLSSVEALKKSTSPPKSDCLKTTTTTTTTKGGTTTETTISTSQSVSRDGSKTPPTSPRRTSSKTENDLYETLLPTSMKACYSSPDSTTTITKKEVVTVDSPKGDVKTVKSPTSTTKTITSYSSYSSSDDVSSTKSSSYSISSKPRTVLERDLCSYCRKPMSSDPKMVLEDMKINCHTTCFKCEVCSSPLGHLKAGDSMWVYRRTVHCERCFEVTREKWHR
ncbi:unnamed protein product [Coregonus sp. 'balchen']|nr:unnamed protein product [Coregonus sp. 'balchen']